MRPRSRRQASTFEQRHPIADALHDLADAPITGGLVFGFVLGIGTASAIFGWLVWSILKDFGHG